MSLLESKREPQACRDKRLPPAQPQPCPRGRQDTERGSVWAVMLVGTASGHPVTCHTAVTRLSSCMDFLRGSHPRLGKG